MDNTVLKLSEGLEKIHTCHLPGKFEVWYYQFTPYRHLMWPLKMCEITTSTVQKMDVKANTYIKKWPGLPRSLSNVGLFGGNGLQLPLKSFHQGYRQKKVRPVPEIRQVKAVHNTKVIV